MTSLRSRALDLWRGLSGLLRTRRDTAPIDTVAALQDFVATRSAYVAQKSLYGYVKARMGSLYPRMFEEERLMTSLDIAKLHVYAACLSDLTVYAVAAALHDQPVGNDARRTVAQRCYQAAIDANAADPPPQFAVQDCIDEFGRRLAAIDWQLAARQSDSFTRSPPALVRWAPIADTLKRHDTEIIENSIRFAWRDIREQFRKRIDGAAVGADWSRQAESRSDC
jgi:hypothetical protein